MMKRSANAERGAALVLVLVFGILVSVWLAAAMLVVQTSSSENAAAIRQNNNQYSAMTATMQAVSQVSNSVTAGIDYSSATDCGLTNSSFGNVSIDCAPLKDSGVVAPLDGVLLFGASGEVGTEQGLSIGAPSGSSCNNNPCALLSLPAGANLKTLSTDATTAPWSIGTGAQAVIGGVVITKSSLACSSSTSNSLVVSQGGSKANCVTDSSIGSKTSDYYKSLLASVNSADLVSGLKDMDTDQSSQTGVPPFSQNTCNGLTNGVLTLHPGRYGPVALASLNTWTAPTTSPCNGLTSVVMQPGTYFFDFAPTTANAQWAPVTSDCPSQTTWCIASVNVRSASFGTFSSGSLCSTSLQGEQIILGNYSRIMLRGKSMALCPDRTSPSAGKPQTSIVALSSDDVTALGSPASGQPGLAWNWSKAASQINPAPYTTLASATQQFYCDKRNTTGGKGCRNNSTTITNTITLTLDYATWLALKNGASLTMYAATNGGGNKTLTGVTTTQPPSTWSASFNSALSNAASCSSTSTGITAGCTLTLAFTSNSPTAAQIADEWCGSGSSGTCTVNNNSASSTSTTSYNPVTVWVYGAHDSWSSAGPCVTYPLPNSNPVQYASLYAICSDPLGSNASGLGFGIQGNVFMPAAPIGIGLSGNSSSIFDSGLIVKALTITPTTSGNFKTTMSVKPPKNTNGNRIVRVTAKVNGFTMNSVVHIKDRYGQYRGSALDLNSTSRGCKIDPVTGQSVCKS